MAQNIVDKGTQVETNEKTLTINFQILKYEQKHYSQLYFKSFLIFK